MNAKSEFWRSFWQQKSDPLHSEKSETYYDNMATELKLLFETNNISSVYEMACGSGLFYQRLGFDKVTYVGVDYSPAMIEAFKTLAPKADLRVADVRVFEPSAKVDLVYSSGMLQYLSNSETREIIRHSAWLLKPGGSIVHACVPWKPLRWAFFSGALVQRPVSLFRTMGVCLAEATGLKPILGNWFSIPFLNKVGADNNLRVSFYGSHSYPYRIHVKFTKNAS